MSEKLIKAISKDNVHMICSAQVILSPAIALKELLENSLDAKATNVEIKVVDHGSKSIIVSDNGTGVKEIDFQSLSKLKNLNQIQFLKVFNFSCKTSYLEIVGF